MKSSKVKSAPLSRSTGASAAKPVTAKQPKPPARKSYLWPAIGAAAAVLVILFAIYDRALHGPFLLDDDYMPYRIPVYANHSLLAWMKGVRPLLMAFYWVNFKLSGADNSYAYHVSSVLLHFFNGLLIYAAIRKLLERAATQTWTREMTAMFCAGIFLLHSVQTEAVSYIASGEPLSVFFFLTAFVVFLYRSSAAISIPETLAVLVLFGAAAASKEHTLTLPAVLLLTDYYFNPGFSFAGIRRNWKLYVPVALVAAMGGAFLWFVVLKGAATAGFHVKGFTWYQYFFTQCRVIWKYILLFVFPFGQNIDADVPVSHSIADHGAILGLIALLIVCVAAWIYRRRFPIASYGWFLFLCLLLPTSSFVPIADVYAERRMYLPFIGLLLIVADFLRRWETKRQTAVAVLAAILIFEGFMTVQRNELYTSALAIWHDAADKSPRKVRPAFQYAFALYVKGQRDPADNSACHDAVQEFSRAASLDTPNYELLLDWGLAYDCAGDYAQALARFQQAAARQPTAHVFSQIGMEYAKMNKSTEALAALNRSALIDPSFAVTYVYRGNVYLQQGDKAKAIADYQRVLALEPDNEYARQKLAELAR